MLNDINHTATSFAVPLMSINAAERLDTTSPMSFTVESSSACSLGDENPSSCCWNLPLATAPLRGEHGSAYFIDDQPVADLHPLQHEAAPEDESKVRMNAPSDMIVETTMVRTAINVQVKKATDGPKAAPVSQLDSNEGGDQHNGLSVRSSAHTEHADNCYNEAVLCLSDCMQSWYLDLPDGGAIDSTRAWIDAVIAVHQ